MSLPRLSSPSLNHLIYSMTGDYADPCPKCPLRDVCVEGCCGKHLTCIQQSCDRDCNDCGGGPLLRGTDANVPAICSKAPLRDIYVAGVRRDRYEFTKRPLIKLKRHSVVVTQGSPGHFSDCPYDPHASVVAVNLRHVWSTRGWFSNDVRDYLKLPPGKKPRVLLLTATHDDVLERAWDANLQEEDPGKIGFDYWQPLTFSQYGDMSRCNNLWSAYRTFTALESSRGWFTDMLNAAFNMGKKPAQELWAAVGEAVPQLMINWQFTTLKDEYGYRAMVAMLKRHLRHVPGTKAIWFMGVVSAGMVYNLERAFAGYQCYYMAVNPWLAAHKGDEFLVGGGLKKSKLPKLELVLLNQKNYATLVQHAVDTAHGTSTTTTQEQ